MPANAVEPSKDNAEDRKNDEAEYTFSFRPGSIENRDVCGSRKHVDGVNDVVERGENIYDDKIDGEETEEGETDGEHEEPTKDEGPKAVVFTRTSGDVKNFN